MNSPKQSFLDFLNHYIDEFSEHKATCEDMHDLLYHQRHGLSIRPPAHWCWPDAVTSVVSNFCAKHPSARVDIVYLSVPVYRKIEGKLPEKNVHYHAWQDIYVGMSTSQQDARRLSVYKNAFAASNLVIAMVPVGFSEMVDLIRSFCPNCLLVIEATETN